MQVPPVCTGTEGIRVQLHVREGQAYTYIVPRHRASCVQIRAAEAELENEQHALTEARLAAEEAKRVAEEGKHAAEEAEQAAGEAKRAAEEENRAAAEQKHAADESKRAADEAKHSADEAKHSVEEEKRVTKAEQKNQGQVGEMETYQHQKAIATLTASLRTAEERADSAVEAPHACDPSLHPSVPGTPPWPISSLCQALEVEMAHGEAAKARCHALELEVSTLEEQVGRLGFFLDSEAEVEAAYHAGGTPQGTSARSQEGWAMEVQRYPGGGLSPPNTAQDGTPPKAGSAEQGTRQEELLARQNEFLQVHGKGMLQWHTRHPCLPVAPW